MWERGLKPSLIFLVMASLTSLPMWERGLKHRLFGKSLVTLQVAPHVGAWIETSCSSQLPFDVRSLTMWERGLKHFQVCARCHRSKSLPMWERGLKLDYMDEHTKLNSRSPCGSVD